MANWWEQDEVVEPREKLDEKRAAKDAEWIDTLRSDAGVAREVAPMATQFLGYNQGTGTGGILTKMGGGWGPIPALDNRQGRQAMEGLTSAMMRATMKPGTSSTMNTGAEQQFAIQRLPNVNTKAAVNVDRVRELQRDAFRKSARLHAAERYVNERGSPDGFDAYWSKLEPTVMKSFQFQWPEKTEPGMSGAPKVAAKKKPEGWTAGLPAAQRKAALLYKGATGKAGSKASPFVPASLAEFQKLPAGSYFIDDDGTVLVKK